MLWVALLTKIPKDQNYTKDDFPRYRGGLLLGKLSARQKFYSHFYINVFLRLNSALVSWELRNII